MEFTDTELEILFRAWALDAKGCGQVLDPEMYPEACRLADAGWLERRYVDHTGDWSWFWTQKAEYALDLGALTQSVEGRQTDEPHTSLQRVSVPQPRAARASKCDLHARQYERERSRRRRGGLKRGPYNIAHRGDLPPAA